MRKKHKSVHKKWIKNRFLMQPKTKLADQNCAVGNQNIRY